MKKYENLFKQTLTCTLLFFSHIVVADIDSNIYSPSELTRRAEIWINQQLAMPQQDDIQINVSQLDERIGDKECQQPLQFLLSQPITQRQNTIQIRCTAATSWQLYVPVRIDEVVQAVVLTQNLTTGSSITATMLNTESRERRFTRGSLVTNVDQVIGAKTRRSLSVGQILTLQDLCLVCKGDVVTISISNNGLNVAATGVAQSDGSLGDTISVLNRQSNRTISADVVAVNQVSIIF
ncbi:flagellar basal body P-ring formation chaperone FlgA [Rheinheimera maricola]|uniref:Flagella basal body P-ring formation protein FlgA n=1 Tax=Rheinheimera maricola TaxID=2793282 RepID=A0ABS7X4F5_9GAMM|nr:flagellar basal body P-ring formation chaperone FlgA [Rheinheimera maricola]MBZ9610191.1 flagellar basal body P-ring formation protein FlgA [Rheinheimera maricola]